MNTAIRRPWSDASNHGMGCPTMIEKAPPATAAIRFGPRAAPLMLSSRGDVLDAASSESAPPW